MTLQERASIAVAAREINRRLSPADHIRVGDHSPEPRNDNPSLADVDADCAAVTHALLGDDHA